jgi:hypothetical protein
MSSRMTPAPLLVALWMAAALGVAPSAAEPLALEDAVETEVDQLQGGEDIEASTPSVVLSEATQALLQHQIDSDRRTLLQTAYDGRPPTWIQHASKVNLGDFPTLNDPTADAERRLRTLEWLLEDRQRRAAEAAAAVQGEALPPAVSWVRTLLPGTWMPFVKEHRDAVLTAGGGVLLVSWLYSSLLRRAGGGVKHRTQPSDAETGPSGEPRKRRRRRRRRTSLLVSTTRTRHG